MSVPACASGLNETALTGWLEANVPGFGPPLKVKRFRGGQSNPTYRLSTPRAQYVLRCRPSGELLEGAHRIDREARVMRALEGSDVPVPHVYALCTDESVIGTWFYVMDLVRGRIFWDGGLPQLPAGERAACYDEMNATLASLHCVDPCAAGLANYGRAAYYLRRQISRWSRQYAEDRAAGRSADMDMLVEWLPAHVPAGDDAAIVHGDFRIDNLVFHPTQPRVVAVLDWELSTIGHPLADFAYHLMMYEVPAIIPWGLADRDCAALGLPDRSSYIRQYCKRTRRDGIPDLRFYLAFNLFRFAAIVHGIKGRMIRGTASSSDAGALVRHLDLFAARARDIAHQIGAS